MIDLPPAQVVCLAQAVYGEARGESDLGKRGVVHVILNRAKKRKLTPCQVIKQPGQFSFKIKKRYSGKDWNKALQIAYHPGKDPTGGAHYFNTVPFKNLKLTTVIGRHYFHR